jgi:hypothetical protein
MHAQLGADLQRLRVWFGILAAWQQQAESADAHGKLR